MKSVFVFAHGMCALWDTCTYAEFSIIILLTIKFAVYVSTLLLLTSLAADLFLSALCNCLLIRTL